MIKDGFDPVATWNELLFCHHVSKFIHVKLSKSSLLGDVDLLMARELEPGPEEGLSHTLFVLQLGADRHYDLANVDPGRCALGPSKGTAPTGLEPRLRTARQHEGPGKGCLQGPFEQPTWTTGCIYCLQALHTRP